MMKFVCTVVIDQSEDGNTLVTQEIRKEGDGQMSPVMREALNEFHMALADFLGNYKGGDRRLIVAVDFRPGDFPEKVNPPALLLS